MSFKQGQQLVGLLRNIYFKRKGEQITNNRMVYLWAVVKNTLQNSALWNSGAFVSDAARKSEAIALSVIEE